MSKIFKKINYNIGETRFCKSPWTRGNECEVKNIDGG